MTVKQIQALDRTAIDRYGVPSLALMENAGRAVAAEVCKSLKKGKACVSVVCGLGNNAGDGFVIARHLINAGVKTEIFMIGSAARLKADAAVNYRILKKCRYRIREVTKVTAAFRKALQSSSVIVDAIFGIGLNRPLKDPFSCLIKTLNTSGRRIIAVDIPSGLDGTTGKICGECIKAAKTVTFTFAKKGFFRNAGPRQTGEVIVVDIGIPEKLTQRLK